MKTITIQIDGKEIEAEEGTTILQAAKTAGIEIPTLCSHESVAPYGACRMCIVEMTKNKRTKIVASCAYPVEPGISVITYSEKIAKMRRMILEFLLPLAPTGPIDALAKQYGVNKSRFETEETACILCGLCVRYCAEVKKANAIGFIGRGVDRKVSYLPGVASQVCDDCRECFPLCPGGKVIKDTDGVWFVEPAWRIPHK